MNTFFNIKVYHFLLYCMAAVATAATASGCQLGKKLIDELVSTYLCAEVNDWPLKYLGRGE